jgi:hypothetical protein
VAAVGGRPRNRDIERVAERHLGYDELRPGQLEGVRSVVGGRHTPAVMSTGSGKSAIWRRTTAAAAPTSWATFGEPLKPPCGRCDACDAGRGTNGVATTDGPFGLGARVEHPERGAGTVQRIEDDMLTVVFDGVGYKTLALEVVEEKGLLVPAAPDGGG